MIEKLKSVKIAFIYNPNGVAEAPPTNLELMEKLNEIIDHINKLEEK